MQSRGALPWRVRDLRILVSRALLRAACPLGRVRTWLRRFPRHLWVLGFDLAALPFLLLAFASLAGGSLGTGRGPLLLLRSVLVLRAVLPPVPFHRHEVHRAASVPPGCCRLLTRTMWALQRFLERKSQTSGPTHDQHRPLMLLPRGTVRRYRTVLTI